MKIAVLTLCRDRLEFTKHCFAKLRENAGCDFDHFIVDQNSDDGTLEWLEDYDAAEVVPADRNLGICRGMNILLDTAGPDYDVYVKFDNDCEIILPDTLRVACGLADRNPSWIVSPHIQGLKQPPPVGHVVTVYGERVGTVAQLGGIFMAVPAWVFTDERYRYNEQNPLWGMDDVDLSYWFRGMGGNLGYLLDYPANHYLTTAGQEADQPVYFERKFAEMGLA